jgi:hypothetical protein
MQGRNTRTAVRLGALITGLAAFLVPASPAAAAGALAVDRTAIDFGDQRVGTFGATERVTVTNTGPDAVNIEDVDVSGGNSLFEFLFDDSAEDDDDIDDVTFCWEDDVTLDPTETCVVDLVFWPLEHGTRTAVMSFESDATNDPTTSLRGNGTIGYYLAGPEGQVTGFGDAEDFGDMSDGDLNEPIINMTTSGPVGDGYWLLGLDGGVFSFGDAEFHGSMGGKPLNKPIVAIASTPFGDGYWLVASDGGVFAFGEAGFYGSMGGKPLNLPIVGIAPTPSGEGYWLVALDGGIFAFGDAEFYGSMGGKRLNRPVVGIASTPSGMGYHEVATDGGMFQFGDAEFYGSMGGSRINSPMVGMALYPSGNGYWTVAADGGVFSFGRAPFLGSLGDEDAEVVAMSTTGQYALAGYFGISAADADDGRVSLKPRALPENRRRT